MGCHRCGARQVDPIRGPSPWKRGVLQGRQVLVCPQCQEGREWRDDLDACGACASTRLVRRLDEVLCQDCGAVVAAMERAFPEPRTERGRDDLGADVSAALDRLFGRA